MAGVELLAKRMEEAGFATESVEAVTGGFICVAGTATLRDGGQVFAKTLAEADADMFEVEAAGLSALDRLGGVRVPAVVHVSQRLLVLEALRSRREEERFWEQLGQMIAVLHTSTVSDQFGWHRDGWQGRMRQDNSWDTDGYSFYVQYRILRWLPEPLVEAEFDREERQAVERLCAALPELIPPHSPSLTHGDLWLENILADDSGTPALIDPAVSYTWPEVDLAALWCSPRPPASERFFAAYEELARPCDGWRGQVQLLRIWDLFSTIAHGLDTWGAADTVRAIIAPFRHSTAS